jgi:ribosome-binding factor A
LSSSGKSRRRASYESGNRASSAGHSFPRSARINETLREVLAEELERLEHLDTDLGLLTITAVRCDPDMRHAVVFLSSLGAQEHEALEKERVRLQAAVASQVRLKRTPQLRFEADPAVAAGGRVEEILRTLGPTSDSEDTGSGSPAQDPDAGPPGPMPEGEGT